MNNLTLSKQLQFALYQISNVIFYIYSCYNILLGAFYALITFLLEFFELDILGYGGGIVIILMGGTILLSLIALICPIIFHSFHKDPDLETSQNPKRFMYVAIFLDL